MTTANYRDEKGRFVKGHSFGKRFNNGHIPWNRETKNVMNPNKTSFKLGDIPWNKKMKGFKHGGSFKKGHPQLNTGRTNFKKGGIPWNKGIKGTIKLNKTSFKKGHTPWNKGKKTGIKPWLGKKRSKEDRIKMSATKQGKPIDEWENFISFEPYDKSFNNKFKNLIRKRDNQICMLCGIHREKLKESLAVHHIDYDKKLTIPENCISLCRNCHGITQVNREYWINFFQSLLSKKYGYQYENKTPIINLEVKNDY